MTSSFNSQPSTDPDVVIRVENLYKEYRLGTISHGTLYKDLQSWWARMRGKEDPNSIISTIQPSTLNSQPFSDNPHMLALNDVSFEVKRGEVLGIIGRNGAGKSTLLKILSEVTAPTKGTVKIKGRVASLLEVGTGFHPELTGRENIYLNGAILGMTKKEIDNKFDEIVAFAEIEKFIDTPVKRYSSGMYVRLAFAVAAHLEPEILIIDEVLAVGDAQFQKKCLGKMGEVSKQGRTVLFVSHNMTAVKNLCNNCIYLQSGQILQSGPTNKIVNDYLEQNLKTSLTLAIKSRKDRSGDGKIKFTDIEIISEGDLVCSGEKVVLRIHLEVNPRFIPLKNVAISLSVNTLDSNHVLVFFTEEQDQNIKLINKNGYIDCIVNEFPLTSGSYFINLYASVNGILSDYLINAFTFVVDDSTYFRGGQSKHPSHPIYIARHSWHYKE